MGLSFLEELMVTGNTFMAVVQNALRSVPMGTVFQFYGAPSQFSRHFRALTDRGFPNRWTGRGGHTAWSRLLQI
jgi:hypothetical protein